MIADTLSPTMQRKTNYLALVSFYAPTTSLGIHLYPFIDFIAQSSLEASHVLGWRCRKGGQRNQRTFTVRPTESLLIEVRSIHTLEQTVRRHWLGGAAVALQESRSATDKFGDQHSFHQLYGRPER